MTTRARQKHSPEKILDAAMRCFARAGFHGASMHDICAECGMSPGALYRHFPSKEALVMALVEADREHAVALITRASAGLAGEAALDALLDAALADIRDHERNRMRLEFSAESARNASVREAHARSYEAVLCALTQFIEAGQLCGAFDTALRAGALARLLFALADGIGCWRALEPEADDRELAQSLRVAVRRLLLNRRADALSIASHAGVTNSLPSTTS
jgi:AcrR family transcriptional regulator